MSNMQDLDKALSDIADIKDQIAASRLFRGFGPVVIGLSGVLALCVMLLQILQPGKYAADPAGILWVWVATAFVALAFILAEMWALSRRHHGRMALKMIVKVLEGLLPALMTGGLIGLVLLWRGSEHLILLPPIWQFLVAIGLFAAMGSLHRNIYAVAIWYFICGAVTLVMLTSGHELSPLHMGIPFGVGQILMGLTLAISFPKQKEAT